MRKLCLLMLMMGVLVGFSVVAAANTVASSTMHFSGTLTDAGGGVYTVAGRAWKMPGTSARSR